MAENYVMLEELGSGSFGTVYKARDKRSGELVAIKHIDLEGSDDDIRDIQQEITVLSTCASQYVTQYKASFVRGTKLWIVMEYLGGGSCLDLLKPGAMTESQCAIICRELLFALDYLHQTGKIHRDIKAANVLLSHTGRVKIADFGVAAQLSNIKSQRMTFVGTPFWMAPEVIEENGYDFKADIWSLGITAMELAMGEPPNASIHPMKVLFHIPKAPAPRLEGPFTKDFKDFVAQCLQKDADRRPTAKELLRHRFIRSAGKVEQLRDVIRRHERWSTKKDQPAHTKYYEETLKDLSPQGEPNEWIFDTIKPAAAAPPKRRKMSRIPSDASDVTNPYATMERIQEPAAMLQKMDLNAAPLGTGTVKKDYETMMRRPSLLAQVPKSRKASTATVQRVVSGQTPTSRKMSAQKTPLGLDMTFGNSPASARPFRRVSSGEKVHRHVAERKDSTTSIVEPVRNGLDRAKSASTASTLVGSDENTPPQAACEDSYKEPPQPMSFKPIQLTKQAMLGRRAYSKVIDATFQESHASTGDLDKREALARLHQAWSLLDRMDPEGEFLLLRSLIDNLKEDPKLSSALGLSGLPPAPNAPGTPQTPSSPAKHAQRPTAYPSPSKPSTSMAMGPPSGPATPRHRQTQSVSNIELSPSLHQPAQLPSPSKQRFVLARNNPHLESHRRRQSTVPSSDSPTRPDDPSARADDARRDTPATPHSHSHVQAQGQFHAPHTSSLHPSGGAQTHAQAKVDLKTDERRLPGYVPPGMEQAGALGEALYARWLEGLRSRWGIV